MANSCPQCSYNDDYTQLISVPRNAVSVTIPSSVKSIYGGDSSNNAFLVARSTITTCFFEENSQLQVINQYAFSYCSKLQEIDLSKCSDLTTIEQYAFYGCSKLGKVTFPSQKLNSLAPYAFSYCGITSIKLPSSITTIGEGLFVSDYSLVTVEFDENIQVSNFPNYLFRKCTSLVEITIPNSVTAISDSFDYCYSLVRFHVSANNTKFIEYDNAIYSLDGTKIHKYPCGKTGSYTIRDNVTLIDSHCFMTSKLSEVIMPDTIKTTGIYVFYLSNISSIILSSNITSIGSNAFQECVNLKSIVLPEGLKEIGDQCFYGSKNLENISLPSTLNKIGGGAFLGCSDNLNINIQNNDNFKNENEMLINTKENLFIMYTGSSENIIIDKNIKEIGTSAFRGNTHIENIEFDDDSNLKTINYYAFQACANLKTFTFPPKLEQINLYAFDGCINLQSVVISSPISKIGNYAFLSCRSITTINLTSSNSILTIEHHAFLYCYNVTNIELCDGIKAITSYCFSETGLIEELVIPETVTLIEDHAFYKSKVRKIIFKRESQLESLFDFAFAQCENLESLNFPPYLKNISQHCFTNTKLQSITLPETVDYLGEFCFSDIPTLINFTIPENSSLEEISYGVFSGCSSFTHIFNFCERYEVENTALYNKRQTQFFILPPNSPVIYFNFPTTLRTIKPCALMGCHNLEIIFIPSDSVEEIGRNAFENCVNLRQINIPISVKEVYSNLFLGCTHLQCGLRIENRSHDFINKLVNDCKLPLRCISECSCTKQRCKYDSFRTLVFITIVFSAQ